MKTRMAISALSVVVIWAGLAPFAAAQDPSAEWEKSKHATKELAADEATWEGRQEAAAHCGRCHSEQGFVAWLPQLMKGDPGFLKKPDGSKADEAFIKGLGLTKDKVRPITCAACHESGSLLRVRNDIPMLPDGLPVRAVGKGALCMACHNAREGRIEWNSPDPKRYTQPHDASQTDVILGKNVYFYDDTGDTASPHALFTGDSCVSCHKELGRGGHLFKPPDCSACHGQKVTPAFVQSGTDDLLRQLAAQIERKLMASKDKIACVTSWDPKADKDTPNAAIEGSKITSIEIPPAIHGQISLKLVMEDGRQIYSQLGNIKNACGDQGKPVYSTSDPVVRALWNYLLFTNDGSRGVHNPRFARNVVTATMNALSR